MIIYKKNKKLLEDNNIYNSSMEHDACGVGMVASTDGKKYRKIVEHGNLNSVRTFVDIDDAMSAYWLAATKGKVGEIYNIGGNKVISVKDFLIKLKKLANKKIFSKLDKSLLRPQDLTLQIASSKKFKLHTGWKTKVNFNDSVEKLLNECRGNIK